MDASIGSWTLRHAPTPALPMPFRLPICVLAACASLCAALNGGERPLNFENDILPILSRHGCNASGCHGKAEGQNGFKLSVFGFDPAADYRALVVEGRGRRVSPAAPEKSFRTEPVNILRSDSRS